MANEANDSRNDLKRVLVAGTPVDAARKKVRRYVEEGVSLCEVNNVELPRTLYGTVATSMDMAIHYGHIHLVNELSRCDEDKEKALEHALFEWSIYYMKKEKDANLVKVKMEGKMENYTKYWPRDLEIRYFNIVKYLYEERMKRKWNGWAVNELTLQNNLNKNMCEKVLKKFVERQEKQLAVDNFCGWVVDKITGLSVGKGLMIGYLSWTDVLHP